MRSSQLADRLDGLELDGGAAADSLSAGVEVQHDLQRELLTELYEQGRDRGAQLGILLRGGQHPFLPFEAFYLDDADGNEVEIVARMR